ncbi:MAG: hypothetical protein Q9183_001493 [Haloplaca sp. 2 TL-2023]
MSDSGPGPAPRAYELEVSKARAYVSGAQRGALQAPHNGNDTSYTEEPPETPAPVFALRAFKTTLFGTPHPSSPDEAGDGEKPSPTRAGKSKQSPLARLATPKAGAKTHTSRALKATPLTSPTKGILVTPGTAATRRKTVSFGNLEIGGAVRTGQPEHGPPEIKDDSDARVNTRATAEGGEAQAQAQARQPDLTSEEFEAKLDASKSRLSDKRGSNKTAISHKPSKDMMGSEKPPPPSALTDVTPDVTMDLSKPRSQSGQHWKAEYERYQKNSDREFKRVIQHEQNVKSYAEKKDAETRDLQDKLKRELDKCAAMEFKVSKLATQLVSGRSGDAGGSVAQETLIHDLSKQTALALKYRRKADRYRKATQHQKLSSVGQIYDEERDNTNDLEGDEVSNTYDLPATEASETASEIATLQNDLRAMRIKLNTTEERAAELEASNAKLKRDFLRLKSEMKNDDGRHLRREASWREREKKLMADNKACEAKLRQLKETGRDSIRSDNKRPLANEVQKPLVRSPSHGRDVETEDVTESKDPQRWSNRNTRNKHQSDAKPSTRASIDIWTTNSNESGETTPSAADPAVNISSIAMSEANHDPDALREIDRNSIQDYPSQTPPSPDSPQPILDCLAQVNSSLQPDLPSTTEPWLTSASKRMNDRRQTIASPRPSVVTMASSAVRDSGTPKADPGWHGEPSLVSTAAKGRSTLTGARSRSGDLPPDRMAAAKARLAQRKTLKENRR